MHQKFYPRRLNAKEVLITLKDGEFVCPVADGSARSSARDYEFQEPTPRRESTVRRQNLSGESQGDREEFQPEESKKNDEEVHQDFGLFKETIFIVVILKREFNYTCRKKNHFLFH